MLFKNSKINKYVTNRDDKFYKVKVIIDSRNKRNLDRIIDEINNDLEFNHSFKRKIFKKWRMYLTINVDTTYYEKDFYYLTGEMFCMCSENFCELITFGFDFTDA